MTRQYQTIRRWLLSCETEYQIDNLKSYVSYDLIVDEKERDDIIMMIRENDKRRDFVRSKQAMRFSDDEFHGDNIR